MTRSCAGHHQRKNILPRVAAKLDVPQISEIIKVVAPDTFERPIYAGNAIETVQAATGKKVITVRTTAFKPRGRRRPRADRDSRRRRRSGPLDIRRRGAVQIRTARADLRQDRDLGRPRDAVRPRISRHARASRRQAARRGRRSRAAVDAGYVPNDYQVGQTGKVVAPDLYIAVGISGAIQHLAGMKDSKVIVAINKDEEAPIFQVADYGLVADLFTACRNCPGVEQTRTLNWRRRIGLDAPRSRPMTG